MSVHDGVDVRPQPVDERVHGNLGCAFAAAFELIAIEVADDHVAGLHPALADAGRSDQKTMRVKANGEIAVVGRHPPFFVHEPSDFDKLLPEVLFGESHLEYRF